MLSLLDELRELKVLLDSLEEELKLLDKLLSELLEELCISVELELLSELLEELCISVELELCISVELLEELPTSSSVPTNDRKGQLLSNLDNHGIWKNFHIFYNALTWFISLDLSLQNFYFH